MDIIRDYRARKMRAEGATFRDIAADTRTSLTRVRKALQGAPASRQRREIRQEIREAGGLRPWWQEH